MADATTEIRLGDKISRHRAEELGLVDTGVKHGSSFIYKRGQERYLIEEFGMGLHVTFVYSLETV